MFLLMTLHAESVKETSIYKRLHEIMNINEAVKAMYGVVRLCCYGNRYMYRQTKVNL